MSPRRGVVCSVEAQTIEGSRDAVLKLSLSMSLDGYVAGPE
jgi:hypothetical protein